MVRQLMAVSMEEKVRIFITKLLARGFGDELLDDVASEPAIAFPLRIVEDLIARRILRERRVDIRVFQDVSRFVAGKTGFQQQQPA